MNEFENIRLNAELVLKTFGENNNVNLAFDEDSVKWLDGYIERNRKNWDEQKMENLSGVLGSFLGECIRSNFGGEWKMDENGLGIVFSDGNVAYPFHKIKKQMINGEEDSIASFYTTIPIIFNQ
jgi:hypothetical protein